eukprot:3941537-Rhodomonas_salina.14
MMMWCKSIAAQPFKIAPGASHLVLVDSSNTGLQSWEDRETRANVKVNVEGASVDCAVGAG